jgi:hypothetical protein
VEDALARVRTAYDADSDREWGRLGSGTRFRLERHPPPADVGRRGDG